MQYGTSPVREKCCCLIQSFVFTDRRHPNKRALRLSDMYYRIGHRRLLTKSKSKNDKRNTQTKTSTMKFAATLLALIGSSAAFSPLSTSKASSTLNAFVADEIPGALAPVGFFDPLGFAAKADENTLKRYREAELTHGRVAMLASVGFLVGEKVEGSSFLFDSQITGPAITHLAQVPVGFWVALTIAIGAAETRRAEIGWVEPENVPVDQPGLLRAEYTPGDIGFDPLGLNLDSSLPILRSSRLRKPRSFKTDVLLCLRQPVSWLKSLLMVRVSLSTSKVKSC